jgi:hypothetical protein
MSDLKALGIMVHQYLVDLFEGVVDLGQARFSFDLGAAKVLVDVVRFVDPLSEAQNKKQFRVQHQLPVTLVEVWSPVLIDVDRSTALFQWVATKGQDYRFGNTKVDIAEDGQVNLIFSYKISADTLDEGELKNAVLAVASTANSLAKTLKPKFGGKLSLEI